MPKPRQKGLRISTPAPFSPICPSSSDRTKTQPVTSSHDLLYDIYHQVLRQLRNWRVSQRILNRLGGDCPSKECIGPAFATGEDSPTQHRFRCRYKHKRRNKHDLKPIPGHHRHSDDIHAQPDMRIQASQTTPAIGRKRLASPLTSSLRASRRFRPLLPGAAAGSSRLRGSEYVCRPSTGRISTGTARQDQLLCSPRSRGFRYHLPASCRYGCFLIISAATECPQCASARCRPPTATSSRVVAVSRSPNPFRSARPG